MSVSFDFSGKTVFVSGGTSGINLGIAQAFGAAGAKVFVISRSEDKVAAATASPALADVVEKAFLEV